METGVSPRYFVSYPLWKLFFLILTRPRAPPPPPPPPDLISLTILITVRLCALFSPKIREIKKNKVLKFTLPGNYISELSTEIEIWY